MKLTIFTVTSLLAFLVAAEGVRGTEKEVSARREPGAQFAARIETLLESLKETEYQHLTEIDESNGSVKCDCSGLVGFILRHEFPEAYVSLKGHEAQWRKRPVSATYYETFMAAGETGSGPWRQVTRLMDAVPGDVLAWRKKSLKAGSTTGHTCMIAGKPENLGDGKVRVRLIDSTRAPHENDTRPDGKTGLGAGFKTFVVDNNGACTGYLVGERHVKARVAIGRIVQATSDTAHANDVDYIGMSTTKAIERAKQVGRSWRIIRQNGKPQATKWLIQDERLNFVIEYGNVIRVLRG